jgi:hypothetical protein
MSAPTVDGEKLLHRLPVQSEIEAVALDFDADAQADD